MISGLRYTVAMNETLPTLLAGPILRKTSPKELNFWLATSAPCDVRVDLHLPDQPIWQQQLTCDTPALRHLRLGQHLYILLIHIEPPQTLPEDTFIAYDVQLQQQGNWLSLTETAPHLIYPNQQLPRLQIKPKVSSILHGSCRKPHHLGTDGLAEADTLLQSLQQPNPTDTPAWPSFLLLSGDQIYADDVATPTLQAIHQLSHKLGLFDEPLPGLQHCQINNAEQLYQHQHCYYHRQELLPHTEANEGIIEALFTGAKKPIFTSVHAHNHLISLGEYLLMYLLVWSPTPWQLVHIKQPADFSPKDQQRYRQEHIAINEFINFLPQAARAMAHLPCAMIFDDHDVSDDWNLNLSWEQAVYNHPLSKRMVGNGLLAYCITQGWGNAPDKFSPTLLDQIQTVIAQPGTPAYEACLDELLKFQGWDYQWPTEPALVVLDTRTRRWRSEQDPDNPSGLLDWEALQELQDLLKGKHSVMLASAAPIFGVKLIEVIQRIFTWFGKPLTVDAENWMSHPGTANGILDIFRHPETPENFTVLSGDVHYSFVYDVAVRGHEERPHVWQVCSSGIRNTFPDKLINTFDFLNRWLFAPWSPLNWFTRRRNMRITPRKPDHRRSGQRLLNGAGIGLIEFDEQGCPQRISQLTAINEPIRFERVEEASSWE